MRTVTTVGAIAAGLFMCVGARATDDDYPRLATMSLASGPRQIQVSCEPTKQSSPRPRIHCKFTTVDVSAPSPLPAIDEKEIAAAVARMQAQVRKDPVTFWKTCGPSSESDLPPDGPDRKFWEAVGAACRAHDVTQLVQVQADYDRQYKAHTCRISQWKAWAQDFEQVDTTTWVANSGPNDDVLCHVSSVQTLSRQSPMLWKYTSVETAPDTTDKTLCAAVQGTHVTEYSWRNARTRDLGCTYLDL
jgi:hypothetical protein